MESPIVIGNLTGPVIWPIEVYHYTCAKCGQVVDIIKYQDAPPLEEGVKVLCKVCLANHYTN